MIEWQQTSKQTVSAWKPDRDHVQLRAGPHIEDLIKGTPSCVLQQWSLTCRVRTRGEIPWPPRHTQPLNTQTATFLLPSLSHTPNLTSISSPSLVVRTFRNSVLLELSCFVWFACQEQSLDMFIIFLTDELGFVCQVTSTVAKIEKHHWQHRHRTTQRHARWRGLGDNI